MKASGNTILITGGGTGIGLALAVRFLQQGNQVVICGRRLEMLNEMGNQGWQLCSISPDQSGRYFTAYFKRPRAESKADV